MPGSSGVSHSLQGRSLFAWLTAPSTQLSSVGPAVQAMAMSSSRALLRRIGGALLRRSFSDAAAGPDSAAAAGYHVAGGPSYMRGAVFWEPGRPLTLEEFRMPRPKAGELLIKTKGPAFPPSLPSLSLPPASCITLPLRLDLQSTPDEPIRQPSSLPNSQLRLVPCRFHRLLVIEVAFWIIKC